MFNIEATDFDLLSSSHLNDPRLVSAFKMLVFCWKLKGSLLTCEKCSREITIDRNRLVFDPIASHRAWCPVLKNNQWKKRIDQIETILLNKSRHRLPEARQVDDVSCDPGEYKIAKVIRFSTSNRFCRTSSPHRISFTN